MHTYILHFSSELSKGMPDKAFIRSCYILKRILGSLDNSWVYFPFKIISMYFMLQQGNVLDNLVHESSINIHLKKSNF